VLVRFAWLAFFLFAARASALAECEEALADPEPSLSRGRLILPCAVADNALQNGGLACADAAVYVVTHDGVLLCQIDVPTLAPSTSPQIERAPAATLSTSTAFAAAGLWGQVSALPPPLVVELTAVVRPRASMPHDGFSRRPAIPS
jgi:hypothetical protein